MLTIRTCKQCGEDFVHSIPSNKATNKKMYCDYCLRDRDKKQRNKKVAKQSEGLKSST